MPEEKKELNLCQKILKIADMAGVLQRSKQAYSYKYVPEEEIQAKVTAGMQKYNVLLIPSLVQGTLKVEPYHYEKPKTRKVKNAQGKEETQDYTIPVNEVIVSCEIVYTWIDANNPSDRLEVGWAYVGQMEDAAQAFGAGATYCNRYFLMKSLQLATTEDDPDNYRGKQKEAEAYEEDKALKQAISDIAAAGSELIKQGIKKEKIMEIVAKFNDGNGNPSSIKNLAVCNQILEAFKILGKKE